MELLVIVACLSILAAMLFPALAQVREAGRRTVCLSNLRQIADAHTLYLQDWDEQFPDWRFAVAVPSGKPREFIYWMEYLQLENGWVTCHLHRVSPWSAIADERDI
jgi:type II secretory pathway pseudopilin PulG